MTPCVLITVALSIMTNACQRADEHRVANEAAEAISGFSGFYYDHETRLDGLTFPEIKKNPLPLPSYVYRVIPPEFLHDVVAAEVILPDDGVGELVPLSRLRSLKALSVTWARYSDTEMGNFEPFTGLQYLKLSHCCSLTDNGLLRLAALRNLKVLTISADGISESGIEMLRSKMSTCTINGRMARRDAPDAKATESGTGHRRR